MTYRIYDTAQGEFSICWDTCCQIIKSYHRAQLQYDNSKEEVESQARWASPTTWALPELRYIVVDWEKVARGAADNTLMDAHRLAAGAMFSTRGVDALVRELQWMQAETRRCNDLLLTDMRAASKRSISDLTQAVASAQSIVVGLKVVRDLAGSILIGAATAATGGAAGAAVFGAVGGTALKSIGKYQDTGSYGAAAVEATQNIVFVVLPAARGVRLAGNAQLVKVIASATGDSAKAMLEGRSLGTALAEGGVSLGVAAVGEAAKTTLKPMMTRLAVPVVAKVLTAPKQVLNQFPIDVAKKVGEDRLKKSGQGYVKSAMAPSLVHDSGGREVARKSLLADQLSFDAALLLKLAVIDQKLGVGRSWW